MPALALAAKLQRKASAVGMVLPGLADEAERVAHEVGALVAMGTETSGTDLPRGADPADSDAAAGSSPPADAVGDALFALVSVARSLGVDAESALRARAASFRREVEARG
jgi:uncharacterized protein YabN with tetrapyrrole methylase and pyrophosphatase domain